jgi:hypothetical protein
MPRHKSGRKRGRPRKANARRRTTTRIGRRTGVDPVDEGSPQLLRKRRAAAGRTDIETIDLVGILHARELISLKGA